MYSAGIIIVFIWFFYSYFSYLKENKMKLSLKLKKTEEKLSFLQKEQEQMQSFIKKEERKIKDLFSIYELANKIASFVDEKKIMKTAVSELSYFKGVSFAAFGEKPKDGKYLEYKINKLPTSLFISVREDFPEKYIESAVNEINLCLDRAYLYKELQQLSIYDSLTSLANRRHFMVRYYQEFFRAQKFKFNMSFLMIDIDDFKKINDTYGHITGDVVLKKTAQLIKENIREIDFIGRLGGEEFAVILPETGLKGAVNVAERIRKNIKASTIEVFDEKLNITISIGIASYPKSTTKNDLLIEIADKALYKAKQLGKNRAYYFQ